MTLGELLVDFIAHEAGVPAGEATSWSALPGGAPANVAVGAARLGVPTSFLGKVGDDPFGRMLERALAAEGVETSGLRFEKGARTALAFVSLGDDGERSFHFYRHPSADMLYRPDEVDLEAVRQARVLHFGSISLIAEPSRSATLAAVEAAREAGVTVTFDPNLRLDLWPGADEALSGIFAAMGQAHVVKLSEEELEFVAGGVGETYARELARELDLLVITRAAKGALLIAGDTTQEVPAFETNVVDTTGAGDSFMAALVAGIVANPGIAEQPEALREVALRANACAAITVSSRGAIPALPHAERLVEFLAREHVTK